MRSDFNVSFLPSLERSKYTRIGAQDSRIMELELERKIFKLNFSSPRFSTRQAHHDGTKSE
jgi:hypothetical protein